MARYKATLETSRSPDDVFAYLSDFSTTAEWDPGVVEAERLGRGPIARGSQFRLVAKFLGRKSTLIYSIVEYEPPVAVALRGENASVVSFDRITFERRNGGTRITYDADLALNGVLKLADPLLGLAFKRVGDRALSGMREALQVGSPR
ncbi:MAG TPA: SRPBCC family protein [Solirubrobacteraceae bacterium]|nr:SRPBCC family protein [Solirubrobacteraceae bacterium]